MKLHTFRIKPDNDLKIELEKVVKAHNIQSGFIVTCGGSVEHFILDKDNSSIGD
jgi:uncharacterized protein